MSRFVHAMPFGTQVERDGTRFRVWAPDCERVGLRLEGPGPALEIPLPSNGDGWFEVVTADAEPGTRYRYRIDGAAAVPDPASRFQPDDVHGASEVVDPLAYRWRMPDWRGRPWEEAALYELHVGAFTPEGTFAGVETRLDDLVELGVTAIELMPVADFPGRRDWGYDGTYLFAPDSEYGRPEDLKRLIDAAHARGLMVLLDVVYNHFGPEGNYLHVLARSHFFHEKRHTPWGAAINFDSPGSGPVRRFFVDNVLYWLQEYRLDGLRFDAVDRIDDRSSRHILDEIAETVHAEIGQGRHVHLVLENDRNEASRLERTSSGRPRTYTAQWNDDIHHALHVTLTGESGGYYLDYADDPTGRLARCLAEGFAYQGEPSAFRGGDHRGQESVALPPDAFVAFLQNHDQIGNRAFGERIDQIAPSDAVWAARAIVLLAPAPPLLFMGEEWASGQPFLFFCDFGEELQDAVRDGRRREFASFPEFADPKARERIPDPNALETFEASRLDWDARHRAPHAGTLARCAELLAIRHREIVPRLAGTRGNAGRFERWSERGITVRWTLGDGSRLTLTANLDAQPALGPPDPLDGRTLYASADVESGEVPAWFVGWTLEA